MLNQEQSFIKEKIFNFVDSEYTGEIEIIDFDGIKISYDGKKAVIGCKTRPQFARALLLLSMKWEEGAFELVQKPHFDMLAFSLDVARNGVFTINSLKRWVETLAALGFTHISLYMEDVFELEGYPRLGYLRGRYSREEMTEFSRYCDAFGLEVIPNVQSLGHMGQYLQWEEAKPIRDTSECLLVDEPKTYEFLEKAISYMREIFPNAKYLSLNLDEAHDLGTGVFADKKGYEPRSEIFQRHAARMYEIAKKYNFNPTIDGDMFFRNKSKFHHYYDASVHLTPKDAATIPEDMIITYWDYYHLDKKDYQHYLDEHMNLGRPMKLIGAIWTWEGFVDDTPFTYKTSIPFLQVALENKQKMFMCAVFGDNGEETNYLHSIPCLPIFSEYCYRGLDCTEKDIFEVSEFLTKMPFERKFELGRVHGGLNDDYYFSRKMIYGDIFYNLTNIKYDYDTVMKEVTTARDKAYEYMQEKDRHFDYYQLVHQIAKLTAIKCELLNKVREAYDNGDKDYLEKVANEKIPQLIEDYRLFIELYKKDWLNDKKPNGIEHVIIRIGGAIEMAKLRSEQLNDYLEGRLSTIVELDEKLIEDDFKVWHSKVMSPSIIPI